MDFLSIPTLTGALATLEPLAPEHATELTRAVTENDLYKVWYTRLPSPEGMDAEIENRLAKHAAGQVVPWAIQRWPSDRHDDIPQDPSGPPAAGDRLDLDRP